MSYIEQISKKLYDYVPPLTKQDDFEMFWKQTLEHAKDSPLNIRREKVDYPIPDITVYKIVYNGFDTTDIHGWFIVPQKKKEKYPCLIHYHGFGNSSGEPWEYMHWVMSGMAVLAIDCREQLGATGNHAKINSGNTQSVICKGILNKEEYYLRALYIDCIKAIDFAINQPEVDEDRIIIEGGSQGGGLVMAVAALDPRPIIALADVPSNSNIDKRVENENGAFKCVAEYLREYPEYIDKVFETLSYFDTMNMADLIRCRVLASVGLKDSVCPAELYFATYNRIKSEKQVYIYPFNGHEGGGRKHTTIKLEYLNKVLKVIEL
ncbi:acetylxylan esterase [Niameybacter massiliensis]|uniref:acetylxylan esterase n=1 Tax=Niameybacter massiliensis TaxID=1658108 RepID=UPI0006B5CCAA|nr:acetylxylan esterase [Niameybacter massiliensis]